MHAPKVIKNRNAQSQTLENTRLVTCNVVVV